ncbi:PREDICTED: protein FAR1-RELATED SEQUENCE 5-like [Ipomoea nil]|uniref:protein FAR1-RELATED SEQUENCE 5-like n=1 Tax=Ipomoea nil TaxID=35883 RepID=UPI000900A9E8|nr:PREDICTED: protein FAR1-RELATED SEQUENCE 5-like [Ipomoea nil]
MEPGNLWCAAVNLDSVGGVCDKDNSTDVGGCDELNLDSVGVEGIGGCDEVKSSDVGVQGSDGSCNEGNSTDVGVEGNGGCCNEDYFTDAEVGGSVCDLEISPGLNKYWCPVCADSLKPHVGQKFDSLDGAIAFYKQYAGAVGFYCRQGSNRRRRDGVVVEKHVLCSREGFKQTISVDAKTNKVKRRRVTNRVGYKVNRSLDAGHQMFIASCFRANIGSVRSYRLFKEIVGDYSNVGATGVDFKNFKRDLMAYILNGDAQLFIDTLFKRRELCEAFDFEYDVDDVDQLSSVFWADAVSRKNFALFGDVVSFDATYRTNRYKLVFVPFTGIDNHKRSITFGAGLLTREDVDSYVWLLEKFKKTMRHDPICVVTDQDPAVKVVVARVFGTSKHRFCMWHIMCKVGEKVGPVLSKDEVFRRKLNGIVWNKSLDSNAFEDA